MPRREPPAGIIDASMSGSAIRNNAWLRQCLTDLREGKHARGCECAGKRDIVPDWEGDCMTMADTPVNACTEIVRCALEMEGYDVD